MPIKHRIERVKTDRASKLGNELLEEIRSPKASGQPEIVIEPSNDQPNRVTVIWDEWDGLDQRDRSEIITDAIYRAHEDGLLGDATRLYVALGLTRREAERMGIRTD